MITLRESIVKQLKEDSQKAVLFTSQECIWAMNSWLTSLELIDLIDKLHGTCLWRQELKVVLSKALKVLEKYANGVENITGVDDEAMFSLMDWKKELVRQISNVRMEDQAGLAVLISEYFKAPELTLHRLGITLQKQKQTV
jgi:hypothetical protein